MPCSSPPQRRGCSSAITCRRGSSMRSSSLLRSCRCSTGSFPATAQTCASSGRGPCSIDGGAYAQQAQVVVGLRPPVGGSVDGCPPGPGLLRLLRRQGRRKALQQGLQGGGGAQGRADRGNDG